MKRIVAMSVVLICCLTPIFALSILTTIESDSQIIKVYSENKEFYHDDDKVIKELSNGEVISIIGVNYESGHKLFISNYKISLGNGAVGYINSDGLNPGYANTLQKSALLENAKDNEKEIGKINLSSKKCPLRIFDVFLTSNSIDVPEVNIRYLNKGNKTIKAFSAHIYCFDVYGDPINILGDNILNGEANDKEIGPGEIGSSLWTLNLYDLTKKVKVKIYKVLFSDGTIWRWWVRFF